MQKVEKPFKVPFTIAQAIKYSGINVTKYMCDLCPDQHKTMIEEIMGPKEMDKIQHIHGLEDLFRC